MPGGIVCGGDFGRETSVWVSPPGTWVSNLTLLPKPEPVHNADPRAPLTQEDGIAQEAVF